MLNKYVKTEADEPSSMTMNQSQLHKRKISQMSTQNPQEKYEIDGVAGKGTFGTVYVGHVRGTGKKIAIKKVLQDRRYKNR